MPKYAVEIPGRGIFNVESPTELTDAQAYQAVLDQIGSVPEQQKGIGAALKGGTKRFLSSLQTGVESLTDAEKAAKAGVERQEAISQQYAPGASLEAVKKAYEEQGLFPAAGEALSQIPSALAEQFPNIAASLASGRAGAIAGGKMGGARGALLGGFAGVTAPSLAQLYGSNLERQSEEGADISRGRALAAAVPGAAGEAAATLIPLGRGVVGKIFGPEAEKALARGNRAAVERMAKAGLARTLGKGALVGLAAEGLTEVAQQMLERAQAGLDLTSDDALAEYGEAVYGAGLVGGPFGALGRVGERGVARGQLAEEERKAKAEEDRIAAEAEATRKASPEYRAEIAAKIESNKKQIAEIKEVLKDKTLDPNVVREAKERLKELDSETKDLVAEFKQGLSEEELPTLEKALARQAAQTAGVEEVPLFTAEEAARDRAPFSLLPSERSDQEREGEETLAAMEESEIQRENQVLLQEIRDIETQIENTPANQLQQLEALAQRKRMMVNAQKQLADKAKKQNITLRKPPEKLQTLFEAAADIDTRLKNKDLTPEKRMVLESEKYKVNSQIVEQTDAYKEIETALNTATKQLQAARESKDANKLERAVNKVNELRTRLAQLNATPGLFDKENLLRMEQREQARKELEEDQGVKSFIGNLYDRIGEYKQKVAAKQEQKTALAQRQQNYLDLANRIEGFIRDRGVELLGVTPERRQKIEAMIVDGSLTPELAKEVLGVENIELDTLRDEVQKIMQRRDERTEAFLNGSIELATNRAEQQAVVKKINELEKQLAPFQKTVDEINAKKAKGLTAEQKKQRADARREINKIDKELASLRSQLGANAVLTREGAAAVKDEVRLSLFGQLLLRQKQVAQERAQPTDLFTAEDVAKTEFTGRYDENGQPIYVSRKLGTPALQLQGTPEERGDVDPELRLKRDNNLILSYFNDAIIGLQRGAFAGTRPEEDPYEVERNQRLNRKLEAVDTEIATLRQQIQTPGTDPRVIDNIAKRITQLEGRRKILRAGMTEAFEGAEQNFQEVVDEANKLADSYSENAVAEINAARAAKGLPPLEGAALSEFYKSLPPGDAPRVGTTPSLLDFFRGKFGEFIERASSAKASVRSAQNKIDELRRAIQALAGKTAEQAVARRNELEREANALENSLRERGVPETQRPFAKIHSALGTLREGLEDVTALAKGEQTELQKVNESMAVEPFAPAIKGATILPESRKSELRALAEQLKQIEEKLETLPQEKAELLTAKNPTEVLTDYIETLKTEQEALKRLVFGDINPAFELDFLLDAAEPDGPIFDYYAKNLKDTQQALESAIGRSFPKAEERLAEINRQLPALEKQLADEKTKVSPRAELEAERGKVKAEIQKRVGSLPLSTKAKSATELLESVLKERTADVESLEKDIAQLKEQAKKAPKSSAALVKQIQETQALLESFKDTIAKTKKALVDLDKDNTFTYSLSERTAFFNEKTKQRDTFESALEAADSRVSILKELAAFARNDFPAVQKLLDAYQKKREELQKLLARKDKDQAAADVAKAKKLLDKQEQAFKDAQVAHTQKQAALTRATTPAGKAKAKEALKEAKTKLEDTAFDFVSAQADLAEAQRAEKKSITAATRARATRAAEIAGERLLTAKQKASDFTRLVLLDQEYFQQKYVALPAAPTENYIAQLKEQARKAPKASAALLKQIQEAEEQRQAIQERMQRIVEQQKKIEQRFEETYKDVLEEFGLTIQFPSEIRETANQSIAKAENSFKILVDGINSEIASLTEKLLKEPTVNAPALRKQYAEVRQKLDAVAKGAKVDPKDYTALRALFERLADEIRRAPQTKAKAYRDQLTSLRKELDTLEKERVQFIGERETMYISGYAKYINQLASQVDALLPKALARQKRLKGAVDRFADAQKMQQQRTDKLVDALIARINQASLKFKKSETRLKEAERQAEAKRTLGTITVKGQELPVIKVRNETNEYLIDREASETLVDVQTQMADLEEELNDPELTPEQRKSKIGSLSRLRGRMYKIMLSEDPLQLSNELVKVREEMRGEKNVNKKRSLLNREKTLVSLLEQAGIIDVVSVKEDGKKAMKIVTGARVKGWTGNWQHANGAPVESAIKDGTAPNYTLQTKKAPLVSENLLLANAKNLLTTQIEEAREKISTLEKERASPQSIRAAKVVETQLVQRLNELDLRKMTAYMSDKKIAAIVRDAAMTEGNYGFVPKKDEKGGTEKPLTSKRVKEGKEVTEHTDIDYLQASGPNDIDLKDVSDVVSDFGIKSVFDPRIGDAPTVALDWSVAEPILKEVQKKVARNNIKFKFYRNAAALPDDIKEQIIAQGLTPLVNNIKGGVAPDGTVFVIAENHTGLLDLEKTLTHEFVGHYSFESLLGPEGMVKLTKRVNASFGSVMKLAEKLGVLDQAEATYVSGMKAGLTASQSEIKALKEVIAYTTEAQVSESFLQKASRWIKEMIGAFRARLRELGLANLSKLSTSDLFYMIRQAKREFEAGKPLAYQAADGTVSFRGATETAPRTGIEGMIATKGKTYDMIKSNVMGLAGRVKFLDRFAALEALVKRGVDAGVIAALKAADVMYFARMADQRHTVVAQVATNGPPRLVKNKDGELMYESGDGPSLKDVSEALKNSGVLPKEVETAFTAYAIARRAKRVGVEKLDFSGKKVTRKDVEQALAKYGNNKAFQKAFELYQDYNAGLIAFAVETGAMSKQKGAELMRHRDYVPFYRVQDGQAVLELFGEGYVRIGDIKNQPYLRELIGGDEGILPIFTSALQNTTLLTDMALKNMATRNAAYVMRDLGVAEIHKAKGGSMGPSGPDIIRFKRDGENYWAKVDTKAKDVLFGDIPTELVVTGMEGLKAVIPDGVRLLGLPTNWLRKFVTRDPRYAIRQVFRDSMAAALTTGADFVPVVQTLKDMATMKTSGAEEKLQKRFILGGQAITGASDDMSKILNQIATGATGWEQAMAKLDALAIKGDAATRVSMYNSFIKQGLSERDATFATLEAMNFSRRGVSPTVFYANTLIPFFSASLQGLDVLYRSWRSGQKPYAHKMVGAEQLRIKQKLLARGAMMAITTMAYAAMMQDDEAYEKANPDERYSNWFVPTPLGTLRVPIPFELGLVFKAIPEGIIRLAASDDKAADVVNTLSKMAIRSVPIDLPTIAKPAVELMLNKSFFTDRDIVDASMERDPNARIFSSVNKYQYRPQTPEVIKLFGAIGLSPVQVEHFLKGYTGSMLVSMTRLLDPVFGGEVVKPDMRITDVPVLGGLFQPEDAGGIINAAYKTTKQVQAVQATYKRLIQEDPEEAERYLNANINNLALASVSGQFRQQMGDLTQWERSVRASKTMTGEEKREQLDEIRKLKSDMAKQFNDTKRQIELQASRSGFQ